MAELNIHRKLYGDRTLLRSEDPATGDSRDGWADIAHEAVRAMNHLTSGYGREGDSIPAPVVYDVLGNLAGLAHMLPQLCEQLAGGLAASLEELNVYDDKRDPAESVAEARQALLRAASYAGDLAAQLDQAQVAINSQGYNA